MMELMLWAAVAVEGIVLFVVAALGVGLLRQIGVMSARLSTMAHAYTNTPYGPPADSTVAATRAVDVTTGDSRLVGVGDTEVVLFISPTCQACRTLVLEVPHAVDGYTVALVCESNMAAAREWKRQQGITALLVDEGGVVARAMQVEGITPFAVVLRAGVVAAAGVVNHWDEVSAMVGHAFGHPSHRASETIRVGVNQ